MNLRTSTPGAKIKVIGVGGGGGNAVNTMIRTKVEGVDFITANTDIQALKFSLSQLKFKSVENLQKVWVLVLIRMSEEMQC